MATNLPLAYGSNPLDGFLLAPNTLTACPALMSTYINFGTFTNDATAIITNISFLNSTLTQTHFFVFSGVPIPSVSGYKLESNAAVVSYPFLLSATTGECASGAQVGTLAMTMSSTWLSGNDVNGASTAVAKVTWANVAQNLTTTIYVSNLPFNDYFCDSEHKRLYVEGAI